MRCCQSTNEEAIETVNNSEGDYSDADQEGSCSTQKESCSSQEGSKKRKVGSNDATKHGRQNFHGYYLRKKQHGSSDRDALLNL